MLHRVYHPVIFAAKKKKKSRHVSSFAAHAGAQVVRVFYTVCVGRIQDLGTWTASSCEDLLSLSLWDSMALSCAVTRPFPTADILTCRAVNLLCTDDWRLCSAVNHVGKCDKFLFRFTPSLMLLIHSLCFRWLTWRMFGFLLIQQRFSLNKTFSFSGSWIIQVVGGSRS